LGHVYEQIFPSDNSVVDEVTAGTDNCKAEWAEAQINLPQIVQVQDCWTPEPPERHEISQCFFERVRESTFSRAYSFLSDKWNAFTEIDAGTVKPDSSNAPFESVESSIDAD
jgi:hypothetical protein